MQKLSEMILPGKLNVLMVNDPHVEMALATVLKCDVGDIPDLSGGEVEFQTTEGSVTVVLMTDDVQQFNENSTLATDLHARTSQENKTFLVVTGWRGAYRRPRVPARRLGFLSARALVVSSDGQNAYVLRDQAGPSMVSIAMA